MGLLDKLEKIMYMKITYIKSRQIFDSRGCPTIETDLVLENEYSGRSSVPSGASKGMDEAFELRDGNSDYNGMGVLVAVDIINKKLRYLLYKKTFPSQESLDDYLIALDGTLNKSNFGANTILSISVAFAKATA